MSVPGAPRIVHAPQSSDGVLEFTWLAPLNNGGSAITNYKLTLNNGGPTNTYSASVIYAKITGLTNGTLYTATLEASNNSGSTWGPAATFRPFQPQAGGPPSVPTNVTLASLTESTVRISWTPSVSGNPNWYVLKSYSENHDNDPNQIRATADGLTQTSYVASTPSDGYLRLNLGLSIPYTAAAVNYPGYSSYVSSINSIQNGSRIINTESINTSMVFSPGISFGTQPFTIEFWVQASNDGQLNIFLGTGVYLQLIFASSIIYVSSSNSSFNATFSINNKMTGYGRYVQKYYIVCRDGSNQLALWVNGVRAGEPQICTTNFSGNVTTIPDSGVASLLSNLRIVVGTSLYDTTQAVINVPVNSYLTPVANTKLLLIDQVSNTNPIDVTGTQTITFPGTVPTWAPFPRIFNPSLIPGCILWLDGFDSTTLLTTGGTPCILETGPYINVVTWKDKSGTGNDFVVPNGVAQPYLNYNNFFPSYIYPNPCLVHFNNSSLGYMQSTNLAVYPVDCFIVLQNYACSGNVFGIAAPGADNYNALYYGGGGSGNGSAQNNSTGNARTPGTSGSVYGYTVILEWSIQDGNYIIRNFSDSSLAPSYIVSQASYTWTMTPGSYFVLGANNLGTSSDPTNFFTSDVAEVIAFNSPISNTHRIALAKYLGIKYGIVV
jgi:hypothetical protein